MTHTDLLRWCASHPHSFSPLFLVISMNLSLTLEEKEEKKRNRGREREKKKKTTKSATRKSWILVQGT